jgi:hypothetical protein
MTKSVFAIAAAAVLLFAAAVPSTAEPISSRAVASVPFAFDLGGATMPAGKYYFETRPMNGMLVVTDTTGRNHAYLTMPAIDAKGESSARLVFEKRGSTYRLAQVWSTASGMGAILPKDKKQDKLAQLRKTPAEFVTLALNRQ